MPNRFVNSLQGQLVWRLVPSISLLLAVGALSAFVYARHIGSTVYDRWIYDSAMTLARQIKFENGGATLDLPTAAIQMFEWDSVDHIFEQVRSRKSGSIYANADFPPAPDDLNLNTPRFYDGVINGMQTRVVALLVADPADPANTAVVMVGETKHKRESLETNILGLIIPMLTLVLVLIGVGVWYAINTSLRRVQNVSARLSQYDASALTPLEDADEYPVEVRPLLDAINQLIRKVAESHDLQQRFIANAAHQLRTPLATLRLQAERALREPDSQKHSEALSDVLSAVARSQHLVRQLMTLARSEQPSKALSMTDTDLADLIRSELESWIDVALSRHVDLGYEGPDAGVIVLADAQLLRELLSNLIDNAIQYGGEGNHITVRLEENPTRLTIEDNGPGIAADEKIRVLERFYRSPSATGTGCGLGLSIANEIARIHGATLEILDNPQGGGTRIEIVFKSFPAPRPTARIS